MVSVARSTPGPLPYQTPVTPSWVAVSGREIRLASPYRRGGELLVEARDEGDVVLGENLGHAVKHLVDATEGGCPGNRRRRWQYAYLPECRERGCSTKPRAIA